MHPYAQIFLYHLPTSATALAGVAWINQYDTPASLFRFARRILYELFPRRIRYAFRQAVVFEHSPCVQVLKCKGSETIDQLPAFLVGEVRPAVRYPFVDATDNFSALHSFWRTLLGYRTIQATPAVAPRPHGGWRASGYRQSGIPQT
jgi:hypothetical protein